MKNLQIDLNYFEKKTNKTTLFFSKNDVKMTRKNEKIEKIEKNSFDL